GGGGRGGRWGGLGGGGGVPGEQAAATIRETAPELTTGGLRDLSGQLPARVRRVRVGEEALENCPADTVGPDAALAQSEGRRVIGAPAQTLITLDPSERPVTTPPVPAPPRP